MSRIGKQPVSIPDKVKVGVVNSTVSIEGPKGKVSKIFAPVVKITVADKKVTFAPTEDSRFSRAMYGTVRSIVAGMVKGVTDGYSKDLEIQGVGFKANLKGKQLDLALGYSHPIIMDIPEGIKITVVEGTKVKVRVATSNWWVLLQLKFAATILQSLIRVRVSELSASVFVARKARRSRNEYYLILILHEHNL